MQRKRPMGHARDRGALPAAHARLPYLPAQPHSLHLQQVHGWQVQVAHLQQPHFGATVAVVGVLVSALVLAVFMTFSGGHGGMPWSTG